MFLGCPAGGSGTYLPLQMELLVQDQGHLLTRGLTDKRAGLPGAGSVEQRNSCSSCTHHFVPRPSALKQAELGDAMSLQMERGAQQQAGMG